MAIDALVAWLAGSVVAPDAFARTVNGIRGAGAEYRRLTKNVRETTGKLPRYAYRRWFFRDSTWGGLVTSPEESYDELVECLKVELGRPFHLLSRRPSLAERHRHAEQIVDATIRALIPSLEPSRAVAVAEHRVRTDVAGVADEIKEVKNVLSTGRDLPRLLEQVPPPAREPIKRLSEHDAGLAAKLLQIVTGNEHPSTAVTALAADPPDWLERAPMDAWLTLAEIANAHGVWNVASMLWEKMADFGVERARHFARAALAAVSCDDDARARRLVEKAQRVGGDAETVGIVAAALDNDAERIVSSSRDADQVDIAVLVLAAEALVSTRGLSSAIAAYRRAIERYPQFAGLRLRLALHLQQASHLPASGSMPATLREARSAALAARDLWRRWRGLSGDAVAVACGIAATRDHWDEVLTLGRPVPDGEATPEEAATPGVQRAVIEAALASGQPEIAAETLDRVSDPCVQRTLRAQHLLAVGGSTVDAAQLLHEAWSLASNDADRLVVWSALAALGEQLPDRERLETRNDVEAALVLAQADHAAGDTNAAVARLRAWRNKSWHVIGPLVGLYLSSDSIDAAVDTLIGAAARFDDPTFLAQAAHVSANRGRLGQAEELAVRALTAISDEPRTRLMLHDVLIAASQSRGAWREMEARVRASIDEHGETVHLRWLLVGSLFNQRRFDEAWASLQTHPALEADTEPRARVWIHLHTRFRSDPALADELLSVIDQFGDSPDFTAAAIGYFYTSRIHKTASEDSQARWRTRIARFIEEHPAHPGFFSISIPDDPEGMIAALRPYLEPGSQQFEELQRQVANAEIPYGMLSVLSGKPYATALMHRAAGCLPIHPADDQLAAREASDARGAMHGSIVIDTSALTVLYYVASLWPKILGSFQRIVIPAPAHADIVQAAEGFRLPSDGNLGWDTQAGLPSIAEANVEHQEALRNHSEWMAAAGSDLDVVDWPRLSHLPRLEDLAEDDRFLPWLTALDYAVTHGHPLFTDDLVLRALARAEGIATFGTVGILRALAESGAIEATDLDAKLDTLRHEYCVDLPLDADALVRVAQLDQWEPRAAAFAFSRPTAWRPGEHTFRVWRHLGNHVAANGPEHLSAWLYAGITGAAHGKQPQQVTTIAATMLFSTTLSSDAPAARFPELLKAARNAAKELAGNDLLPRTITLMLEAFTPQGGPEFSARAALWLTAELDEQDRSIVREAVFLRPTST
ncbi:PIN domain-containing protein [Actinophytocola glycyrrhizae]|uniref:PIN domain-containing protein n=1 Tax=Actinophytocola glycyrrhizae TaxID=2044873 RepID=A0ABV9SC07_9PSEU